MFLHNIVVHIHAKYRKDRMETEGAFSIWKTVDDDGRTGGGRRTMDGSVSDKLRWLCQQRS